jgi:hypothetical protein
MKLFVSGLVQSRMGIIRVWTRIDKYKVLEPYPCPSIGRLNRTLPTLLHIPIEVVELLCGLITLTIIH